MIGDGLPLSPFGALTTLDIENAKVMEGITFGLCKRFSLIASGTVDIVMDPTGFTGEKVVLVPIGFDAIGGPIEIDVYRGVTANEDGTVVNTDNKNHQIAGAGEVFFMVNPTGIVTGSDLIGELLVPSDGTGAAGSSGASAGEMLVCVLDHSKKYLFRITNTDSTAAAKLGMKMNLFEVL